MSISARRHHENRKKKEAEHLFELWGISPDKRLIGIISQTPKPCSCPGCGNPRKHFGEKTMQEKIAEERMEQEIEEWWEWQGTSSFNKRGPG